MSDFNTELIRDAFSYLKLWDMIRRYDLDHVLDLHGTMPTLPDVLQIKLSKAIKIRQYFESTADIDPDNSQKLLSKYREYVKDVIKEFAKSQGHHLRKTGHHEYRFKPLKPVVFHIEEPNLSDPEDGVSEDNDDTNDQSAKGMPLVTQRRRHIRSKPHWRKSSSRRQESPTSSSRRQEYDRVPLYYTSESSPSSPEPQTHSRGYHARSSRSSSSSSSDTSPSSDSSPTVPRRHHTNRDGRYPTTTHREQMRPTTTRRSSKYDDRQQKQSEHRDRRDNRDHREHDERRDRHKHRDHREYEEEYNKRQESRRHYTSRSGSEDDTSSHLMDVSEYHPLPTIQSLNNPDDVLLQSSQPVPPQPPSPQPSLLVDSPPHPPSQPLPLLTLPPQPLPPHPPSQPLPLLTLPPQPSALTIEFNSDLPSHDAQPVLPPINPVSFATPLRITQVDRPPKLDGPDMDLRISSDDSLDQDSHAKAVGARVSDGASVSVNPSGHASTKPAHLVGEESEVTKLGVGTVVDVVTAVSAVSAADMVTAADVSADVDPHSSPRPPQMSNVRRWTDSDSEEDYVERRSERMSPSPHRNPGKSEHIYPDPSFF